jgi:hypothetical protein
MYFSLWIQRRHQTGSRVSFRGAIVFNYQHGPHIILDVLRILEKDVGGTDLLWALNDKEKD